MGRKQTSLFTCQGCSYQAPKWLGQCPECKSWNSFQEEVLERGRKKASSGSSGKEAQILSTIEESSLTRLNSGIQEFDRVMGGGIVPGSLTLIGGEPGIGKSTLLLQVAGKLCGIGPKIKVFYASGEESLSQIASRARRLGIQTEQLYLLNETALQTIFEQVKKIKPDFLIIDSVQTTISREIESAPGTVSQIREVTYEVMNLSKAQGITSFIVGHVTKEGTLAGPKILEHMVDTVVYFEGDHLGHYRLLRAIKNRFGNTNEVGLFEMNEEGLREVRNPSQFFLDGPLEEALGRSLTCIVEGSRSLFVEIQGLVVDNKGGHGRRTTQGFDSNRLAMLIAVIEKYIGVSLAFSDVYVNVVGGLKIQSREADLAVIAALLSSLRGQALDDGLVFLGEVGLTGEVRTVPFMEMRLKEMVQLSYKKVITAKSVEKKFKKKFDLEIRGLTKASQLEEYLF